MIYQYIIERAAVSYHDKSSKTNDIVEKVKKEYAGGEQEPVNSLHTDSQPFQCPSCYLGVISLSIE